MLWLKICITVYMYVFVCRLTSHYVTVYIHSHMCIYNTWTHIYIVLITKWEREMLCFLFEVIEELIVVFALGLRKPCVLITQRILTSVAHICSYTELTNTIGLVLL